MAEGTFQLLNTPLSGEQPFSGDLLEGELAINTADGRVWAGNAINNPVELGGAVKNRPIGDPFYSNYTEIDLSNPVNLPIPNPDPTIVPVGIYQENRYILRFPTDVTSLSTFTAYFDYDVDWGLKSMWDPTSTSTRTNPIDHYKRDNQILVIELFSFGPGDKWMGRLLWAKLTAL